MDCQEMLARDNLAAGDRQMLHNLAMAAEQENGRLAGLTLNRAAYAGANQLPDGNSNTQSDC
ncbi:MAG TPA: hypothetical protein VHN11_17310 [Xanthobacteraceae bacterium]|nr:hypothetical protein [Xanthobacteraceae bacterium]